LRSSGLPRGDAFDVTEVADEALHHEDDRPIPWKDVPVVAECTEARSVSPERETLVHDFTPLRCSENGECSYIAFYVANGFQMNKIGPEPEVCGLRHEHVSEIFGSYRLGVYDI
jgi:hypothetical protein